MIIRFGYDVVGTIDVEMEVDDEEVEGMSAEEAVAYVRKEYGSEAYNDAVRECDWGIGGLENIKIIDSENEDFDGFEEWYV